MIEQHRHFDQELLERVLHLLGHLAHDRGEWELDASDRQNGETREIRLVLPALSWRVEDVTLVQGGMVVFRWGPQIVLADLDYDRVAMLARGRSPIVFVGEAPASVTRATSQ